MAHISWQRIHVHLGMPDQRHSLIDRLRTNVDFGEALGEIGGVVCKLHYFAMALPHLDAFFIKAYPAETTEAFCDGHVCR